MASLSHWTFTLKDGVLSWACACPDGAGSIAAAGLIVDNERYVKHPDRPALHLSRMSPYRGTWFYYDTDAEAQVAAGIVRELLEGRASSPPT